MNITRKYDRDIETLRGHFPNADGFTASYGSGYASASIHYGERTIHIMMTGRYLLTAGSESEGYNHAEFTSFADLLTWLDGGKAA